MVVSKALIVGLAIGTGLFAGSAAAQEDATMTSDGSYVVADDNGDNRVDGGGHDIVYGDIATGGTGGEILGDPNAIYYPDLSMVPVPGGGVWSPTITGIPVGSSTAGNMLEGVDVVVDLSSPTGLQEETATTPTDSATTEGAGA